jgi:hypothetical protein
MHFTHSTPGRRQGDAACFAPTLQIFTLRLAQIKAGLEWPLSVYGVVAARDDVDHNRNLLFSCDRSEAQKLDQDVCISISTLIFSLFIPYYLTNTPSIRTEGVLHAWFFL